ncbi:MAG: methyltransferase domain-containing protein [Leptospiraceae bacterium]|nr:methyltransferase domain-containing protein [Leptospiraceae bacterium]MDW7976302.1 methyltransferase domain-containing protein [Leptospiraceae bacterium]
MRIYSKIFSHLYDPVMQGLEKGVLHEKRKFLLRDVEMPVLEIGFGTGANYFAYQDRADLNLTVIERSPFMIEKFYKKFPKNQNVVIYVDSIENEALIKSLPKFKSIVSTLTLCSVSNLEKSIRNVLFSLSDDGTFYVMEHIRSDKKLYGKFQDVISPAWKLIGDGCHINRETDKVLKQFFYPLFEEYFFAGVDFYLAKLKKRS